MCTCMRRHATPREINLYILYTYMKHVPKPEHYLEKVIQDYTVK